jgi:flagellar biosynthesis/type III secretory pathway M-ring protein FliF/YscJ
MEKFLGFLLAFILLIIIFIVLGVLIKAMITQATEKMLSLIIPFLF